MKWIVLLLSVCCASAQLSLQQMQPFFSGAGAVSSVPGPNSIQGLAYWWVASDVPITTNVWYDRIQNAPWTNGASSPNWPTLSGNSLSFNGTSSFLTNSAVTFPTTGMKPYLVLVTKVVDNKTTSNFVGSFTDSIQQVGFGSANVIDGVSQTPYWKSITNNIQDWVIAGNSTVTSSLCTTNNVSTGKTLNWSSSGSTPVGRLASTANGLARGKFFMYEILVYTNDLTAGNRVTLHTYETNTYSFAP